MCLWHLVALAGMLAASKRREWAESHSSTAASQAREGQGPSAVVFVRQAAAAGARAAGEADSEEDEEGAEGRVSKRKRKLESRLKIAELKQSCPRPEVVEVWDVTAQDPRLLVYLKARP